MAVRERLRNVSDGAKLSSTCCCSLRITWRRTATASCRPFCPADSNPRLPRVRGILGKQRCYRAWLHWVYENTVVPGTVTLDLREQHCRGVYKAGSAGAA